MSILHRAIDHFGPQAQRRKAVEECLELALALTHFDDGKVIAAQVIEEIADVQIMAAQLAILFGESAVCDAKAAKLNRLETLLPLVSALHPNT